MLWHKIQAAGSKTAWDLRSASFVQSFSVSSGTNDISFKPDGMKMYVISGDGDDVDEYNLSTAWNISTASYLQNFSVAAQETVPEGVFFKPDGTKMYVTGLNGSDVNEYNLSSAWDITTASYLQNFPLATSPRDIFFKPDGMKMYIVYLSSVEEYNLSSAWNTSTASYLQNFSVNTQTTSGSSLFFKPDGMKMYVVGSSGGGINEYNLSTAWNISTASYLQNFSVNAGGLFFKPDGTQFYTAAGSVVNEYRIG
jgi:DNA-binding beta-propeller fold protein YncE